MTDSAASTNAAKKTKEFGLDLSKENWETYSKVWDGVYTVNEPHNPGGVAGFGVINNRAFLFEVESAEMGGKHLFMFGIPGDGCIPKVKQLEKDTGLKLKVVLTSGDLHHMAMKFWLQEYPAVTFVHSSHKFPTTRNGTAILDDKEFAKRIILTDGETFPDILAPYQKTTIQFFSFFVLTIADKPYMSADSKNKTKKGTFSYITNVAAETADTKSLCIWGYHVPSKTLIYEHNFQMFISKELKQKMPFFGRMLLPTEQFDSIGKGPIPMLVNTKDDCEKHCQTMANVLNLDVRAMMDFHCGFKLPREYDSAEDYRKDLTKVLSKTGEDDPTGESMVEFMNSSSRGCC